MVVKTRRTNLILIAVALVFTIALILLLSKIRIRVKTEPVITKPPLISFMIINKESDEVIREKINGNPSCLWEDCSGGCEDIFLRTPLLTAIGCERLELAKYMIDKGAPVEESLRILRSKEYAKDYLITLERLIEESKKSKENPRKTPEGLIK